MVKKPSPVEICDEIAPFRNGNFPWDYGYKNFYSHNSDGSEGVWYATLSWILDAGVRKAQIRVHNQLDYTDDTEEEFYNATVAGCEISTTQYGSLTNPFIALMTSGYSDIVVRGFGNKIYVLAAFEYTSPSAGGGLVWAMYDIDTETWTNGYLQTIEGSGFVATNIDILSDGTDVFMCFKSVGSVTGHRINFMKWATPAAYKYRSTTEVPYFGISATGVCYFYQSDGKLVEFDYDDAVAEFIDVASSITEVPASAAYGQCYCYKSANFYYLVTATKIYWATNGYTFTASDTFTALHAPIWGSSNELFAVIYDDKYVFLDSKGAVKFFIIPEFDLYLTYDLQFECGWHEEEGDYIIRHLLSTLWQMQYVAIEFIGISYELPWHSAPICSFGQVDPILDGEYMRLYDDANGLIIDGYAKNVESDHNAAFRCEIDSKIADDLTRPITDSYTATRKAIFEALITDWCEILTIGTIELDDIDAITKNWNNKTFQDCCDELCQEEGGVDWFFLRTHAVFVNNLDTASDLALNQNYEQCDDKYTNIVANSVTVYGKWTAGVQAIYTATSGTTIYSAIEVQAPTLNQAETQALAEKLLTNKNQKYYTYWIWAINEIAIPEVGHTCTLTNSFLSLTDKVCYIKRLLYDGYNYDVIVTDTFIYKLKEMNNAEVMQQQISDVSATVSTSSHNPVTIGTANGLSLATQVLSLATAVAGVSAGAMSAADKTKLDGIEAGAEVNNISDVNATDLTDAGATTLHKHSYNNLDDKPTIPTVEDTAVDGHTTIAASSNVAFDIKTTADAALPKAGGTMSGAIAMGTSKITGLGDGSAAQDAVSKAQLDLKANIKARPYVELTKSSDQALTAGPVHSITWNTEVYDEDGFHNNVTNTDRITIPANMGGVYQLSVVVTLYSATASQHSLHVEKNDDGYDLFACDLAGLSITRNALFPTLRLAAGDYITITAYLGTAGAVWAEAKEVYSPTRLVMIKLEDTADVHLT